MNLPPFSVVPYHLDTDQGSFDMLKVKCPRKQCGREFWVGRVWGVIGLTIGRTDDPPARVVGRPCPYCSRASAIPDEYQIKPLDPVTVDLVKDTLKKVKDDKRIVRKKRS